MPRRVFMGGLIAYRLRSHQRHRLLARRTQRGAVSPGRLLRLVAALLGVVLLVGALGGCTTLGFYQQALVGQLRLLNAREDVDKLLAQPDLSDDLRQALTDSQAVLAFARTRLDLDPDGRYGAYVELEREFVVWNLVVTPVDSVTPRTWCFPVAGCVSYRGYFAEARAQTNAKRFDPELYDTWVGGVPAYSTLGWFDDPLLSSFIHWPRPARAELLFHELAHGALYVAGDTPFNESFATFVANLALPLYLSEHPLDSSVEPAGDSTAAPEQDAPGATLAAHHQRRRDSARFNRLLLQLRARLEADFAALPANVDADGRRQLAREVRARRFAEAQGCFTAVATEFSDDRFARYFTQPPNLARLSLVGAYQRWVGAFAQLHAQNEQNLAKFLLAAKALAEQPPEQRLVELERLSEQRVKTEGNDQNGNDIQCEALANHAVDGDVAG